MILTDHLAISSVKLLTMAILFHLVVLLFISWEFCQAYDESANWRNMNNYMAIKQDGTLQGWGSTVASATPPAGLTNVRVIYSSEDAFVALLSDTTLRCWGNFLHVSCW